MSTTTVNAMRGGNQNDLGQMKTTTAATIRTPAVDLVSNLPKPTLVTYSALMSRAVSLGKPRVVLCL